jgi:hypothetical protein
MIAFGQVLDGGNIVHHERSAHALQEPHFAHLVQFLRDRLTVSADMGRELHVCRRW